MIFVGQSNLTLELETGISLGSATLFEVLYKDPAGNKGQWPGTVNSTKINCTVQPAYLTSAGTWSVQAKAVFPTGVSYGAIATFTVEERV